MRCPNCNRDNPEDARFCSNCGAELPATAPAASAASSTEERRLVTVLFADLAGFTTLAESLDPEDLRALIGRFYAMVAAEVQRFGGTVEKYVGDAALAIFGLPEVHEDDAVTGDLPGLVAGTPRAGCTAERGSGIAQASILGSPCARRSETM